VKTDDGSWNVFVVVGGTLWLAALLVAIFGLRAPNLSIGVSASEIASLYRGHRASIAANSAVLSVGILGLIIFISGLWSGPRGKTSADAALVTVALISGAVFVTTLLLSIWLHLSLVALVATGADEQSLLLVNGFDQVLGVTNDFPFGAFIATFGLAVVRIGVMPRWLGGLGIAAGGCFLLASLGSMAIGRTIEEAPALSIADGVGALLFNVWVLVSVVIAGSRFRAPGKK
jgi:Domain of unknown function (DUF4386)